MWGSSGSGDKNADTTSASYIPKAVSYVSPNGGTEIDVYGGYTHALGKSGVTFDGGVYGYIYPNLPVNNLYEVYGSLTKAYGPLSAKVGVNWAPKQAYFTAAGNPSTPTLYSVYEYGELTYSPPKSPITVHGHLGHTGGGLDYIKQYLDYTVGISYKWKALTFDISAVGTNVTKSDIAKVLFKNGPMKGNVNSQINSTANQSAYRYGKFVPVASLTASF